MPEPIKPIPATPGQPATQAPLSQSDLQAQQQDNAIQQQIKDKAKQDAAQKAADEAAKKISRRINKPPARGDLITFQYAYYKHDFNPLCLVGKLWTTKFPGMISGLNLHYLTFRYIKYLLNGFCGKNFHYGLIKGDKYIVNAYRSYKKEGRRQVKQIDCEYLNNTLKVARSFKPEEVEAIRNEVQRQLKEKLHPKAEQLAQEYQQNIFRQSHKDYGINKEQPDARFNPNLQGPEAEELE